MGKPEIVCKVCDQGRMRATTSGYKHGACAANCGSLFALIGLGIALLGALAYMGKAAGPGVGGSAVLLMVVGGLLLLGGMPLSAARRVLKCDSCGAVVARD